MKSIAFLLYFMDVFIFVLIFKLLKGLMLIGFS